MEFRLGMSKQELIVDLILNEERKPEDLSRSFEELSLNEVQRIPNNFGQYAKNHFVGRFLGAIYIFQNTQLKQTLGATSLFWKYDSNHSILHLVFQVEKEGQKKSYLRSIGLEVDSTGGTGKLSANRNYGKYFKNLIFTRQTKNEIISKGDEASFEWKEKDGLTENNNISFEVEKVKLTAHGFVEVNDSLLNEEEKKFINEECVKWFSSKDIDTVKHNVKQYLDINKKIMAKLRNLFETNLPKSFLQESFADGFLSGGLIYNFKRRFRITAVLQRIMGKGIVDFAFTSMGEDNSNENPYPVLIEDKKGKASPEVALEQVRRTSTKVHPSIKTFAQKCVIAGVNFLPLGNSQGESAEVEIYDINPFKFEELLTTDLLTASTAVTLKENAVRKSMERLFNTRYGISHLSHFFPLLLGYFISYDSDKIIQKKVIIEDDQFAQHHGLLFTDLKSPASNGAQHRIVFYFKSAGNDRPVRVKANSIRGTQSERLENTLGQLKAEADNKKMVFHQFVIETETDTKQAQQKGFVKEVKYTSGSTSHVQPNEPALTFKEVESIHFEELYSLVLIPNKHYKISNEIFRKVLYKFRSVLKDESSTQAIMHGILAKPAHKGVEVRVFGEANHSAEGRADFHVIIAKVDRRNGEIKTENVGVTIIELKVGNNIQNLGLGAENSLVNGAYTQALGYRKNLDSTTSESQVDILAMAFYPAASGSDNCLIAKSGESSISQHSESSLSPDKRQNPDEVESRSRTNSIKRRCKRSGECFEYALNEIISKLLKERKNGHLLLVPDNQALLVLASLNKENGLRGKVVVASEDLEQLESIQSMFQFIDEYDRVDDWLRSIETDFPRQAHFLAKKKSLFNFSVLKNVFNSKHKPLFFLIRKAVLEQDLLKLQIKREDIAAIYFNDYGLSNALFSYVTADSRNIPRFYRDSLTESSRSIQVYSGSIDYFREMQTYWEQEKNAAIEGTLKLQLEALSIAESFLSWFDSALAESGLIDKNNWIPILPSLGAIENRPNSLFVLNSKIHEERIINIKNIEPILNFRNYLSKHFRLLRSFLALHRELKQTQLPHQEERHGIDGLNAAFVLQTLLTRSERNEGVATLNPSESEHSRLSKWLEIHYYLTITQMGHSTVMDVRNLVNLSKDLLRKENSVAKIPLSLLSKNLKSFLFEGLGFLLNAANVVLDVGELTEAKSEAERAQISTQLAFDLGNFGLSVGALGAGLLGEATTASVLGYLGGPVAGLGIGVTELVGVFGQVVNKAQSVGKFFCILDDGYAQGGYSKHTFGEFSTMTPKVGVVFKEINFPANKLVFGSPYLYRTRSGPTGSGKINYFFWAGDFPQVNSDKSQALNIRQRLGYPGEITLRQELEVNRWLLPCTPESYISYSWTNLPFATTRADRGFSVLRKLEEHKDFDYDFYIFPSEYIVTSINAEYVDTTFKIILDSKERSLILPEFTPEDRYIAKYLHYTLQSPSKKSSTIIYLSDVGSIQLESLHQEYQWILICNQHLGLEDVKFTNKGIKILDIAVEIINPSQGQYHLYTNTSKLIVDPAKRSVYPIEINFQGAQNATHLMESYFESSRNAQNNLTIKMNDYPIRDYQNIIYNGTAYYSTRENRYFYTDGLNIPRMRAGLNISFPFQVRFIGCIDDLCYFWAGTNYLWSSHKDTHQIVKRYHIDEREIKSASIIANNTVEIVTVINFTNEANLYNSSERVITYHVNPDQALYLVSISDMNDQLLHLFAKDSGQYVLKNVTQTVVKDAQLREIFIEQDPEDYDQEISNWNNVGESFARRLNQRVSILPAFQNSTAPALWIRAQDKTSYELINPKIQEKPLFFLGSLFMKNGTEVLYFYKPALPSVANKSTVFGKLFLQSTQELLAKAIDLPLLSAFRDGDRIYVENSQGCLEEIDALGNPHLIAVTPRYMNTYLNDWYEKIPVLVDQKKISDPITVYGLHDRAGNALGAWYDSKTLSFIIIRPPVNDDEKQFAIHYVKTEGRYHLFFCRENGILYQGESYAVMPALFEGTKLKKDISNLKPVITGLKNVYFRTSRWYLEMENGEIFSTQLLLSGRFLVEKIGLRCFEAARSENTLIPAANDSTISRQLLYNFNLVFNKNCTQQPQNLRPSALVSLESTCSVPNFNPGNFDSNSPICINSRHLKPTLVDFGRWINLWLPENNALYLGRGNKEFTDGSLGLCKQTKDSLTGLCSFSKKEGEIIFNQNLSHLPYAKNKTRMLVESFIRYGKTILLTIDVNRVINPRYKHEGFIPLFEDINKLGLNLINIKQNSTYIIPEEFLFGFTKVFFKDNQSTDYTLSFPSSTENKLFAQKKGADIILKHPDFHCEWVMINAMNRTDNNTSDTSVCVQSNHANQQLHQIRLSDIRKLLLSTNATILNNHFYESPHAFSLYQQTSENHLNSSGSTLLCVAIGSATLFITGLMFFPLKRRFLSRRSVPVNKSLPPAAVLIPLLEKIRTEKVSANLLATAPSIENALDSGSENFCMNSDTTDLSIAICINKNRALFYMSAEQDQVPLIQSYVIYNDKLNFENLNHKNIQNWKFNSTQSIAIPFGKLYPLLPPRFKEALHDKEVTYQVWNAFYQQGGITFLNYIASMLTLHSSLGDSFQKIGLSPDWTGYDHSHFFNRWLITGQQLLSNLTSTQKKLSLTAGVLETALMYAPLRTQYEHLSGLSYSGSGASQIFRFLGDIMQFGPYSGFNNTLYILRFLEWYRPNNKNIILFSTGIRMVLSFFNMTSDLSYWYLGVSLFVLPQVPYLLEHLGVPVTRSLCDAIHKLQQIFVSCAMWSSISEDNRRIEAHERVLKEADMRVKKGRARLSYGLTFFSAATTARESDTNNLYQEGCQHVFLRQES